MLLLAATESQRAEAGTIRIAGVNHSGATPAETHGSGIAAPHDFLIDREHAIH